MENFNDFGHCLASAMRSGSLLEPLNIKARLDELPTLVVSLKPLLKPGFWFFLEGDLGAGKSLLCREIGIFLKCQTGLESPTYSIMSSHEIEQNHDLDTGNTNLRKIVHLDLYRLIKPQEICYLGLEMEFNPNHTLCLFEWASMLRNEPENDDPWNAFFQTTGCPIPHKIVHVTINRDAKNTDSRNYSIIF